MAHVNLNRLARTITRQEGGKVSLPIGQVKECLRLTFQHLARMRCTEVGDILRRYAHRRRRQKPR